jgi:predicted ATPase
MPVETRALPRLPLQFTSFVGRERELAELRDALEVSRLLTMLGPGGTGKTRLALQLAAEARDARPDGSVFLDMAPLGEEDLVVPALAAALDVRGGQGDALLRAVVDALQQRDMLIVLDNCEHVIEEAAQVALALLSCPQVTVLATSREPLRLAAEAVYQVPPLSLPPRTHSAAQALEAARESEAVELFLARASMVRRGITLDEENAALILDICHKLDGMPLALELAASELRALPLQQLAERLDDRVALAFGATRGVEPRQATLRAVVDWSYTMLPEEEARLFRRLSVFAGGFRVEAALAVCLEPDETSEQGIRLMERLVERSLLAAPAEGNNRYRMLHTIRQFAAEKLAESGEEAMIRDRHRDWYLALAREGDACLRGAGQAGWLTRLEEDQPNFRAALEWSLEGSSRLIPGLEMAASLALFWRVRGHWSDGRLWLGRALERTSYQLPKSVHVRAMLALSELARSQGDNAYARELNAEGLAQARRIEDEALVVWALRNRATQTPRTDTQADYQACDDALEAARRLDDQWELGMTLAAAGGVLADLHNYAAAQGLLSEGLQVLRATGDRIGLTWLLYNLAFAHYQQSQFTLARTLWGESLAIAREFGDRYRQAGCLFYMGEAERCEEHWDEAGELLDEALALGRKTGARVGIATFLMSLGTVRAHQHQPADALALLKEGITMNDEIGERQYVALCILGEARLALDLGQPEEAARLEGSALKILEEAAPVHLERADALEREDIHASLVEALGPARLQLLEADGGALAYAESVSVAIGWEPKERKDAS